jgi:hypothetical protein
MRVYLEIYTTNRNEAAQTVLFRDRQDAIETAHVLLEFSPTISAVRVSPANMRVRSTAQALLFERNEDGVKVTTSNLQRVF